MVKVRISQDGKGPDRPKREPESDVVIREEGERHAKEPAGPKVGAWRGMSERQWFISLLVASGLLLLIAFRGCVLPSGIGPKPETDEGAKQEQAATPTPQVTGQGSEGTYTVQAGDNLGKIAQKTGASVDAIAEANGITRNTILRVGQELKIP
ncbi:MAG: LysM domain-containing protein [Patescibacteria group bacterium]